MINKVKDIFKIEEEKNKFTEMLGIDDSNVNLDLI
jgi:hypothetical protein